MMLPPLVMTEKTCGNIKTPLTAERKSGELFEIGGRLLDQSSVRSLRNTTLIYSDGSFGSPFTESSKCI